MPSEIHITVVLDFMCPYSFIGLRCVELARQNLQDRHGNADIRFFTKLLPLEFDDPGTFPPEGLEWAAYCKRNGAASAAVAHAQASEDRAVQLGVPLGVMIKRDRRVWHRQTVNAALMLAQRYLKGFEFTLLMMRHYFEHSRDPNTSELIAKELQELQVPESFFSEALTPSAARSALNVELTQMGRMLSGGSIPKFRIQCAQGGPDMCSVGGEVGPVSPEYFLGIFEACIVEAQASSAHPASMLPELPKAVAQAVASLGSELAELAQSGQISSILQAGMANTSLGAVQCASKHAFVSSAATNTSPVASVSLDGMD